MLQTEETTGNNGTSTGTATETTGSASTGTSTNRPETGTAGSTSTGTESNATGSAETTGSTNGGGTGAIPPISDNRPRLVRIDEMPEPPAPTKSKRGPKGPWKHKKEVVELNPGDPDEIPDYNPPAKFEKLNAKDLNLMICGTFDMLAVILGKHWAITEAEGEKISKPASRILSRMAISKTINKYSDYTVLLMSVIGVVGPRLLFTLSMKSEPKGGVNNVPKTNVNDGPTATGGNRIDGEKREVISNPQPPKQPVTYPVSSILSEIQPAVMP